MNNWKFDKEWALSIVDKQWPTNIFNYKSNKSHFSIETERHHVDWVIKVNIGSNGRKRNHGPPGRVEEQNVASEALLAKAEIQEKPKLRDSLQNPCSLMPHCTQVTMVQGRLKSGSRQKDTEDSWYLPPSVPAAVTEQAGGLRQQTRGSQGLEAAGTSSWLRRIPSLRAFRPAADTSLPVPSHGSQGEGVLPCLVYGHLLTIHGAPPSPLTSQRFPFPAHHLGVGISVWNLGRHNPAHNSN